MKLKLSSSLGGEKNVYKCWMRWLLEIFDETFQHLVIVMFTSTCCFYRDGSRHLSIYIFSHFSYRGSNGDNALKLPLPKPKYLFSVIIYGTPTYSELLMIFSVVPTMCAVREEVSQINNGKIC